MKLLKLAALLSLAVSTLTLSVSVASAGEVVWWTPNWGEARAKELADKFMAANPGITIRMEVTVSNGLPERVLTALSSGAPPDIIEVQHGWVNGYAQADLIVPLDRRDPGARGLHPRRPQLRHLERPALGHPLPHRDPRDHLQQGDLWTAAGLDPEAPPQTWAELSRRRRS